MIACANLGGVEVHQKLFSSMERALVVDIPCADMPDPYFMISHSSSTNL